MKTANEHTKTDWRELALELANVASELVTVANAAGDGWRVDPLVRGMLHNNCEAVDELVSRVRRAAE
jgi:hypothetical protein